MAELIECFRAQAPAALRTAGGPELERALSDLLARGGAAWPSMPVDPEAVVAQAARSLPQDLGPADAAAAVAALQAADLHLACACAARSAPALAAFDRTLLDGPALRAAIAKIDRAPAFADEVRQALREKLFIGRPGSPPRIHAYSGRWPLASWLRTIAVRTAIDLRRASGASEGDEAATAELATGGSPELRYLKDRYGAEFQKALGAAFDTLDDEQCNLLRLQIVDGLRTAQIAALFRVDRSTIKRRLASCREHLFAETRRRLREALPLSLAELESLAGLLQSQLHVSLARLLRRP